MRTVTTRAPEWSEQDRAWMLALAYWRDSRCPLCGGDIRDCTAPEDQVAVTVPPPRRCQATDALMATQEQYRSSPRPGALLWRADLHRR